MRPIVESQEAIPWNAKHPITLGVSAPYARWYIGENMKLSFEINNRTDSKIKKFTCILSKRKSKHVWRQGNNKLKDNKDVIVKELEVVPRAFPCPKRFRMIGKVNFKLPFSLEPSATEDDSAMEYHVYYFLKVRAGVPLHRGPVCTIGPLLLMHRIL